MGSDGALARPPSELVYIVDDDCSVREALASLLSSYDFAVETFGTLAGYLAFERPDADACLLLDIELPDMSGLEFQARHAEAHPPIVFITACDDVCSSVRAIQRGADDFLTKPLNDTVLVAAVHAALQRDRDHRRRRAERAALQARLARLTPREREVLPLVVGGLLNKQAAAQLGISEVTLQVHRSRIMRKMQAESLPDLVRFALMLGM